MHRLYCVPPSRECNKIGARNYLAVIVYFRVKSSHDYIFLDWPIETVVLSLRDDELWRMPSNQKSQSPSPTGCLSGGRSAIKSVKETSSQFTTVAKEVMTLHLKRVGISGILSSCTIHITNISWLTMMRLCTFITFLLKKMQLYIYLKWYCEVK